MMSADDDSFPIDLCKVNYDDVLHLYRGWRRSENALKEKKRDFDLLLVKTEQLQESHKRFRDQIQLLESVKDVATRLQSELSAVQKENKLLLNENRKLSASKSTLDSESKRLSSDVIAYKEANRNYEMQVALLSKNCEEAANNQKVLEVKLSAEAVARTTAENQNASNNGLIEQLRTENGSQRTEANENATRIAQCGEELRLASRHITLLTEEIARTKVTKDQSNATEAEVGILKGDISRLLRLLDHYPASEGFLNRWYASDGMSFLGMGVPKRKKAPSAGDSIETDSDIGHFLNFELPFEGPGDITPAEFVELKKSHGGDPFPMSATFEEEIDLWIPRQVKKISQRFLSTKIPHAPPRLITEFLRKINKVWIRREQRICKNMKGIHDGQIVDLRRQLANLKPYRGVIAENDIRRLRGQVHEEHSKLLKGRAKKAAEQGGYAGRFEEEDDIDDDNSNMKQKNTRLCEQVAKKRGGGTVVTVSKEKLLEASLASVESLGRQRRAGAPLGSGAHDLDLFRSEESLDNPSEAYLRGALWMGRNFVLIFEEVAESLDLFRTKFMTEVLEASSDPNLKRSRHRLNLLAVTSISESLGLTNSGRVKARDILQRVASIAVGDTSSFQEFLRILPVELTLAPPRPVGRRQRSASAGCVGRRHPS